MITPTEIRQKAEKKYLPFLRAKLASEPFFPLEIRFRKPAATIEYMTLSQWVAQLLAQSKAETGFGYVVQMQKRETRRYGTQSMPQRITIDSATDFLKLIGKDREFYRLEEAAALTRSQLPELETWLCQHPNRILDNLGQWPELLSVCHWFMQNPQPHLYIREIPVDVHTKFIEENRGILRLLLDELLPLEAINQNESKFEQRFALRTDEPLVRVRLLDLRVQEQLNWPATDLSMPLSQFARLSPTPHENDPRVTLNPLSIFITENKMTFLTLPTMPNTMAIWGGGFQVTMLKSVEWLTHCPITYWGDLDVQGFEILSSLRTHFPQIESFLMDEETFQRFKDFTVVGTPSAINQLSHLTTEEGEMHTLLGDNQLRLEQERIPLGYVVERLRDRS